MSDARGQGTIEYVALVALVAAVLAAAIALLVAAGIGQQVVAAFERALCIVTGGPCDGGAGPCVRASEQHVDAGHLNAVVFRIGHRDVELREHRADGTVAVTLLGEQSGGLDVGSGLEAHVRWGASSWAAGSELRVAALAEHGSGRIWVVRDDAAATRLVDRVRLADRTRRPRGGIPASDDYDSAPPLPPEVHAPPPDATFSEHGTNLTLDLQAGNGRAAAHLGAQEAYGERLERATGQRTVYVRETGSARGAISLLGRGAASGTGAVQERYGITYDRSGRPVDFEVLATVDLSGAVGVAPALGTAAGLLPLARHGERHVETEQHLDLTDPGDAGALQAYLAALGDGPAGIRLAASVLRSRLERAGTVSARTYAQRVSAHEVGGQARVGGVGIGGEAGSEDTAQRLVASAMRGPDGIWRADARCAAA